MNPNDIISREQFLKVKAAIPHPCWVIFRPDEKERNFGYLLHDDAVAFHLRQNEGGASWAAMNNQGAVCLPLKKNRCRYLGYDDSMMPLLVDYMGLHKQDGLVWYQTNTRLREITMGELMTPRGAVVQRRHRAEKYGLPHDVEKTIQVAYPFHYDKYDGGMLFLSGMDPTVPPEFIIIETRGDQFLMMYGNDEVVATSRNACEGATLTEDEWRRAEDCFRASKRDFEQSGLIKTSLFQERQRLEDRKKTPTVKAHLEEIMHKISEVEMRSKGAFQAMSRAEIVLTADLLGQMTNDCEAWPWIKDAAIWKFKLDRKAAQKAAQEMGLLAFSEKLEDPQCGIPTILMSRYYKGAGEFFSVRHPDATEWEKRAVLNAVIDNNFFRRLQDGATLAEAVENFMDHELLAIRCAEMMEWVFSFTDKFEERLLPKETIRWGTHNVRRENPLVKKGVFLPREAVDRMIGEIAAITKEAIAREAASAPAESKPPARHLSREPAGEETLARSR